MTRATAPPLPPGDIRVSYDPELGAMAVIAEYMTPLDDAARARVIAWAIARYGGRP
jgi:hypothetical protein